MWVLVLKKKWLIVGLGLTILFAVTFFAARCAFEGAALEASGGKGVEWGLKRNDNHTTPQPPADGAAILEQYGGHFVGDESNARVYFTFDEGYEAGYTGAVLDILKGKDVKAVFFICGWYLKSEPGLVGRMIEEGHSVGNHTDRHKNPLQLTDDAVRKDIADLSKAYTEATGSRMQFYRPPGGAFDARTIAIAKEEGLTALLWSWAYADWEKPKGKDYVIKLALDNVHNGAIYLFHVATSDPVESLGSVIDGLREVGYEIGDPSELLPSTE